MHVKKMDLHKDMYDVIEAHQKEYEQGKGVWKRVEYTDTIYILVRSIRMRKANRYRIFLVDKATDSFVSVMMLDPEQINWRHKEIFYTPTSYIIEKYRGLGLFAPLYRWFVDSGFNLKADSRQSEFSNRLWHRLIGEYHYLTVRDDALAGDTYVQMLNPKRLRKKHYVTLLFSNRWSQSDVQTFADRISREEA